MIRLLVINGPNLNNWESGNLRYTAAIPWVIWK